MPKSKEQKRREAEARAKLYQEHQSTRESSRQFNRFFDWVTIGFWGFGYFPTPEVESGEEDYRPYPHFVGQVHCGAEMIPVALRNCNGWRCRTCGYEIPEIASGNKSKS